MVHIVEVHKTILNDEERRFFQPIIDTMQLRKDIATIIHNKGNIE